MQQEDRFSEDVIKIFHNAKGSLAHKIVEWTNDYEASHTHDSNIKHWHATYPSTPFDHAAGEYEPLPREEQLSIPEGSRQASTLDMQSSSEPHPLEQSRKINALPNKKTD